VIYGRIKHDLECENCPLANLYCRQQEVTAGYRSCQAPFEEIVPVKKTNTNAGAGDCDNP
jgi:hypothetical protein